MMQHTDIQATRKPAEAAKKEALFRLIKNKLKYYSQEIIQTLMSNLSGHLLIFFKKDDREQFPTHIFLF